MEDGSEVERDLATDTQQTNAVGRKSYMSIAKKRFVKEVKEEKQLTIKGGLRARMASTKVTQ